MEADSASETSRVYNIPKTMDNVEHNIYVKI
jgi:hypothetical protein